VLRPKGIARLGAAGDCCAAGFRVGLSSGHERVEYRWAEGNYDRLPDLAADLVRRQVAVIAAAGGEPSPEAAKAATKTIPIVFTAAGDPVKDGLVTSLNRPGGIATGITIFGGGAATKRLQLLHEIEPKATTNAYLMNPSNPNAEIEMRAAQSAAASLGQQMIGVDASNERELNAAFAAMHEQHRRASRRLRTSSSVGSATGSRPWQRVIGYRRCITCANLRTLAVL